jgi:anaerobic ribonucleoside-triphosphate reductase activating protein
MDGGRAVGIQDLAADIIESGSRGLTLSGGDPFAQADALATLVAWLRSSIDISVMSYTGYTIEALLARRDTAQLRLLSLLDILVDGPYVRSKHADLLWRGSSNQRILLLTDRHREELNSLDDRSAGIQAEASADGSVRWIGVPTRPGFREDIEAAMLSKGVALEVDS